MTDRTSLSFSKLEALGNDFVLIDGRITPFRPDQRTAELIADRRLGVGCDQLLVLEACEGPAALCRVAIYNADGSMAEQCGNGMRAVALWLHQRGELDHEACLLTAAGPVPVRIEPDGTISAGLGTPDFQASAWGRAAEDDAWTETVDGRGQAIWGVSMGNPHLVLDLSQPADPEQVMAIGSHFQNHPRLPHGANINLAWREDRESVVLRVHERGAGPTLACGSGACATAAVLGRAGLIDSPVRIRQPGGELVIHWNRPDGTIAMSGPARHVFDGTFIVSTPELT